MTQATGTPGPRTVGDACLSMLEAKGAVHEGLRDTLIRIAREPLGLLPLSDIRDEAKADQMLIALRKRNPYMGNLFKEWRQRFSKVRVALLELSTPSCQWGVKVICHLCWLVCF